MSLLKKVLCLIALIVFLFPCLGLAEKIDFSSMTTEELMNIFDIVKSELEKRTESELKNNYLIDNPNGLSIYLSGNSKMNENDSISIEYVIINNSVTNKSCYYYTKSINGWVATLWNTMVDKLEPGKKIKGNITFYDKDYIDSYNDPITLEFELFDASSPFEGGNSLGIFMIVYDNGIISIVN